MANEVQKQMALLKEHLASIEDEEPVNHGARKGKHQERFLSDDETSLPEPKPEPAQLLLSSDSIDIEGETPERADLLEMNEHQHVRDRYSLTRAVGIGQDLREREEKQEGREKPAAKKCLAESDSQCPTFMPTPDPATSNYGFEYGLLAPAKLLAGSYRLLTAASTVHQWEGTHNEKQGDGSPQRLARSPSVVEEVLKSS